MWSDNCINEAIFNHIKMVVAEPQKVAGYKKHELSEKRTKLPRTPKYSGGTPHLT